MVSVVLLLLVQYFPIIIRSFEQNRWSKKSSNNELIIVKPNGTKIICAGKVQAERNAIGEFRLVPHQQGIVYFETKIQLLQRKEDYISIGFWSASGNKSYGYYSNGSILGHNYYGSHAFPTFGEWDTIGCGMNLSSMNAIYTKNGKLLTTNFLYVFETDLFPRVSLYTPGDTIEANFGPHFMYNIHHTNANNAFSSALSGENSTFSTSDAANLGMDGNERAYCKEVIKKALSVIHDFVRNEKLYIMLAKIGIKVLQSENGQRNDVQIESDIKTLQEKLKETEALFNKFNLEEQ